MQGLTLRFPGEKELYHYGEYRTNCLVLEAWRNSKEVSASVARITHAY